MIAEFVSSLRDVCNPYLHPRLRGRWLAREPEVDPLCQHGGVEDFSTHSPSDAVPPPHLPISSSVLYTP